MKIGTYGSPYGFTTTISDSPAAKPPGIGCNGSSVVVVIINPEGEFDRWDKMKRKICSEHFQKKNYISDLSYLHN